MLYDEKQLASKAISNLLKIRVDMTESYYADKKVSHDALERLAKAIEYVSIIYNNL